MRVKWLMGALVCVALGIPATADAFCGFYVSGAGAKMFNNATMVVMMRDGTRTVLSMQNNYQGPPKDFAMVVPVPVVLQKENVKTLPAQIFKRVDSLAAPRLVEYWEQDPCAPRAYPKPMLRKSASRPSSMGGARKARDLGVTVEAKFTVGEYDVVILSAKDSTGLDTWLRQEKYKIPRGAERYLRPYVRGGSKFFVAKVDSKKVKFVKGQAMLSPLRFHYDTAEFKLPVRLGLMNSKGTQDLIVHILARGQRYEVANYKNVAIPTNLDVKNNVRKRFGQFYASLFDATLRSNRGAVVTEYAWDASSCDPCPVPALRYQELATLGADVLGGGNQVIRPSRGGRPRRIMRRPRRFYGGWVLTRLHVRYGKRQLKDDLVFRAAPPIMGGREVRGIKNQLERSYRKSSMNNFQARYAIRHKWKGKVRCKNPRYGIWGGPPDNRAEPDPQAALNLAFVKRRRANLRSFVRGRVPRLRSSGRHLVKLPPYETPKPLPPPPPPPKPKTEAPPAPGTGAGSTGAATGSASASTNATNDTPTPTRTAQAPDTPSDPSAAQPPPDPERSPPPDPDPDPATPPPPKKSGGCAGCASTGGGANAGVFLILGALLIAMRRRRDV